MRDNEGTTATLPRR